MSGQTAAFWAMFGALHRHVAESEGERTFLAQGRQVLVGTHLFLMVWPFWPSFGRFFFSTQERDPTHHSAMRGGQMSARKSAPLEHHELCVCYMLWDTLQ